ncbi:MAG: hypothetical protein HYU41_08625 [Candidatus Rokubacteria bacterium]|nr:hypothetical protein [Candidatus Rokubacteria bacterium]
MDDIKRTTAPETRNGRQWEVQLGASPSREWLDLFRRLPDSSATIIPQRVVFDRETAFFKSDEEHVELWIRSLDRWIAATNVRHATTVERERHERATRIDTEIRERERIQQLNERFKSLQPDAPAGVNSAPVG